MRLLCSPRRTSEWPRLTGASRSVLPTFGIRDFFEHQAQHGVTARTVQRERELRAQKPERALQIDAMAVHFERQIALTACERGERLREPELLPGRERVRALAQWTKHLGRER